MGVADLLIPNDVWEDTVPVLAPNGFDAAAVVPEPVPKDDAAGLAENAAPNRVFGGVENDDALLVAVGKDRVGVESILVVVALLLRDGEKDLVRLGDDSCMASTAASKVSGRSIFADAGGSLRKAGLGLDCHLSRRA